MKINTHCMYIRDWVYIRFTNPFGICNNFGAFFWIRPMLLLLCCLQRFRSNVLTDIQVYRDIILLWAKLFSSFTNFTQLLVIFRWRLGYLRQDLWKRLKDVWVTHFTRVMSLRGFYDICKRTRDRRLHPREISICDRDRLGHRSVLSLLPYV